jgi:HlyD family secretion protein
MSKPKKSRRRKLLVFSVIAVLGIGFWSWRTFRKPDEIITVQVEKAARRDITETVVSNGRIQPVTQVTINPEVAGEIVELPVQEGQQVKKGDLLLQIKQDNYVAGRNSAEANHKFSLGARNQAEAELERAEADFKRNEELAKSKLISASVFQEYSTAYQISKLRLQNAVHQADQARFALDKANDELAKTTIRSPIDGTVTRLKSQLGERVLGTSFNMGTEIMTVARLDEMEARVDIGEVDIVLIEVGQKAKIEIDAFKDKKFKGTVTAIANAAQGPAQGMNTGASQQDAPKFEVKIRIEEEGSFRPGMSVTAEIETRSRKNVISVPIQAVTTRLPGGGSTTPTPAPEKGASDGKVHEPVKPIEVVFAREGDRVKMIPVKTGISDNDHFEIESGLTDGQEIIVGGYKAISKDLAEGKQVKIGTDVVPKE